MSLRNVVTMIIAAVLIVFTLQNAVTVEVDFLTWHLQLPRAAMLLAFFAAGMVCGWAGCSLHALRRRRAGDAKGDAPADGPD